MSRGVAFTPCQVFWVGHFVGHFYIHSIPNLLLQPHPPLYYFTNTINAYNNAYIINDERYVNRLTIGMLGATHCGSGAGYCASLQQYVCSAGRIAPGLSASVAV